MFSPTSLWPERTFGKHLRLISIANLMIKLKTSSKTFVELSFAIHGFKNAVKSDYFYFDIISGMK